MATNSEMFNKKSGVHRHIGHGKAMFWHGVLMLGMVMTGVALAAPAGAATVGDLAVQSMYMIKDMAVGLVSNADVLVDMAGNAWDGNFAPNTWDAAMSHSSMGAVAGHGAHVGIEAQFFQFDQWLQALSPEQLMQIKQDLNDVYGGMSLRQYHEMNFLNHGPVPW